MKPNKYIIACAMFVGGRHGGCALRKSTNTSHRHARFTERHHYD